LNLKEYEWVQHFLETYQNSLPDSHREATYHYNKARYFYEIGKHQSALEHLELREYDDALQNLTAKILIAKNFLKRWN
jgi:hypothetical protein